MLQHGWDKFRLDVKALEDILIKRGFTKRQLSRKIGAGDDYISNVIKRGWTSEAVVFRIAKVLKVDYHKIAIEKGECDCYSDSDKVDVDYDELFVQLRNAGVSLRDMSIKLGKSETYLNCCKARSAKLAKCDYDKILKTVGVFIGCPDDSHEGDITPDNKQQSIIDYDLLSRIIYDAVKMAVKDAFNE